MANVALAEKIGNDNCPLMSRDYQEKNTVIKVGKVKIGSGYLALIAGPCAIESEEQALTIARLVKKAGARIFRGGAFKPRTSPYAFQGLGEEGLKILAKVRAETSMPVVTEAIDTDVFNLVEEYADIIQIGARNMQNYSLLRRAGKAKKPVLLKRGMVATIEEFLMAAEYILQGGNDQVILCERGIRTFAEHSRNTLDLSAIPVVQSLSHLPIIVDPSHASGRRDQVIPLSRAAIEAGAFGLMIEVHHAPDTALCDGAQSLYPKQYDELCKQAKLLLLAKREYLEDQGICPYCLEKKRPKQGVGYGIFPELECGCTSGKDIFTTSSKGWGG